MADPAELTAGEQLAGMARIAGLDLVERFGGRRREPFTAASWLM